MTQLAKELSREINPLYVSLVLVHANVISTLMPNAILHYYKILYYIVGFINKWAPWGFGDLGRMAICFHEAGEHW